MPIRNDADDLINFLNGLLEIDPYAISELLTVRVPCNEEMANHPSVQIRSQKDNTSFIAPGTFRIGVLGLLNGYAGTIEEGERKGWGLIGATYDNGKLIRFERTDKIKKVKE